LTATGWVYSALSVYEVGSTARRAVLLCWHHDVPVPIWPHMTPSPRPTFQRCSQSPQCRICAYSWQLNTSLWARQECVQLHAADTQQIGVVYWAA
jgi:hypothetical protein